MKMKITKASFCSFFLFLYTLFFCIKKHREKSKEKLLRMFSCEKQGKIAQKQAHKYKVVLLFSIFLSLFAAFSFFG